MFTKERVDLGNKILKILFVSAIFLMLAFYGIVSELYPTERSIMQGEVQTYNEGWQLVHEDNSEEAISIPGRYKIPSGETMVIQNQLPEVIHENEILCLYSQHQTVRVYIDGALRTEYDTSLTRPYGKDSISAYVNVSLTPADAKKSIKIYLTSHDVSSSGSISEILHGTDYGVLMYSVKNYGMQGFWGFILIFYSLIILGICIIYQWIYKNEIYLTNMCWAVFLTGLYMISSSRFNVQIFRNSSLAMTICYMSMMLLPIALLLYSDKIQEGRHKIVYMLAEVIELLYVLVAFILQIMDIVDMGEFVNISHAISFASVVLIVITILLDVRLQQVEDYLVVVLGLVFYWSLLIIETILSFISYKSYNGVFIVIGIFVLFITSTLHSWQKISQIESRRREAVEVSKAKDSFLANMSHEIRTPINAIIGMNEMILRESKNDTISEYASNVSNASNMLLSLVNDILDFSKIESGKMEIINASYHISSVLNDTIQMLSNRAKKKNLEVILDIDENIPSLLWGDEVRIKQVITNLLTNAVKYTEKGSVKLFASGTFTEHDKFLLHIAVSDTGQGIPKENMNMLFQSFVRIDENYNRKVEGTGLGLTVTRQLVELMQGTIEVNSEVGVGTTFSVYIPQAVMDEKPMGNMDLAYKKSQLEKKVYQSKFKAPTARILVVDDNRMNLAVVKGLLKPTQIQVEMASSGAACLEKCKDQYYDVILMDHMMPGMDGIETFHLLRKDNSMASQNVPTIALTANAIAGVRDTYLGEGFEDYLSKPIAIAKLEDILIRFLPKDKVILNDLNSKETNR